LFVLFESGRIAMRLIWVVLTGAVAVLPVVAMAAEAAETKAGENVQCPGVWQSYEIVFHAPVVENGAAKSCACVTVFHNGILIHNNAPPPYPDKPANRVKTNGDIELQSHNDHSKCISFRNVWIRRLP